MRVLTVANGVAVEQGPVAQFAVGVDMKNLSERLIMTVREFHL